jgi:hypothetical protein
MKTKNYKSNPKNVKEGWDLFFSQGSDSGDYQIQRIDEIKLFNNDIEAIRFVYKKALEGSKRHRKALARVMILNPQEIKLIF